MSDLLEPVRRLLAQELSRELFGQALVVRCTEVAEQLRSAYSGESSVPHEVWHYLHDADIRIRDPKFAEAQLGTLLSIVSHPK